MRRAIGGLLRCLLSWVASFAVAGSILFLAAAHRQTTPSSEQLRPELLKKRDQLWPAAQRLRAEGKPNEAIAAAQEMLGVERKLFGDAHEEVAASLVFLAGLEADQDDFAAARQARQEVLDIQARLYGPSHWKTTSARLELAEANAHAKQSPAERRELAEADALLNKVNHLRSRQQYQGALALAGKAVEIRKRLLGEDDSATAAALTVLANLDYETNHYAQAEPLYRRVLEIRRKAFGELHPAYASALNNLANLYDAIRDEARAEPLYEKACDIRRQLLGPEHADYLASLTSLAEVYQAREKFPEARKAREELLAIQTKRYGPSAWQVTDARLRVADVEQRARLTPDQRRRLDVANALSAKVDSLIAQSQYQAAVFPAEQVVAVQRELLGEKAPLFARSLNKLALLCYNLGDYRKAEPLLRQALEIRRQVQGELHPDYASILNNLATVYSSMGEDAKAEPLLHRSLELTRQTAGEENADYARVLDNLGTLLLEMGNYDRAEPMLRRALDIRTEVLGERHQDSTATLRHLADLYKNMGDFAKAEPMLRRVQEIEKEAFGERSPEYARTLNDLGALYYELGDYARAEPLFRRVLEIRNAVFGSDHPEYARGLTNLANLCHAIGDYAQAERYYRESLEVSARSVGRRHPDYADCLNNLAMLYVDQGQYGKAEPLLREAADVLKQAFGETNPSYVRSLHNQSALHTLTEDYAGAEPLCRRALEITGETLGKQHPDYATSLIALAELDEFMGRYAKAEALYREALEIQKRVFGDQHPQVGISLETLALLSVSLGRPEDTQNFARQALEIARRQLDVNAAAQSERQQLKMNELSRLYLNTYLTAAMAGRTPAEEVYREVLDWKGTVWARQQWLHSLRKEGARHPEIARRRSELELATRRMTQVTRLTLNPNADPQNLQSYRRLMQTMTDIVESKEQALAAASQEFRGQLEQRKRTPADLQRALPPEAVLVDFISYRQFIPAQRGHARRAWRERMAAFVVRPQRPVERFDLGPAGPIQEAVQKWRQTYSLDDAATLANLVWKPLDPSIQGAKTILVSPDGALDRFPFAALPGRTPGSYLIEDVAVAVLPVPHLLPDLMAQEKSPPASAPSLLLVGDVNFDAAADEAGTHRSAYGALRAMSNGPMTWPPLAGTRTEIEMIGQAFAGQFHQAREKTLRGAEATKQAIEAEMNCYRYVHLATHGFFAAPSASARQSHANLDPFPTLTFSSEAVVGFHPGLLSGLVLAGANRPFNAHEDDGILTALEVAELDLSGTDLATLSACETGLGQSADGEGLLSLQRAFQVAGARSVVASLWQVPDKATQALMNRFYDNLWQKKLPKLEAMREAQLWLLREGAKQPDLVRGLSFSPPARGTSQSSRRLTPQYWSAFVLSGDWR